MELIGERWALLVVRELLLGPKRYRDLHRGLAGVSHNVLSQRLREMEANGILRRIRHGPPVSSWVYELTEWGRQIEPVVLQLGRWAGRSPQLDRDADLSPDALVLHMRGRVDASNAGDLHARYDLSLGEDRFALVVADGALTADRQPLPDPDAAIETDTTTLAALLRRRLHLGAARADGRLRMTGDTTAVERVIEACALPTGATPPPATSPTGSD
jgi:DNA-binding HxlR family transcriptional regulator